MQHTMEQKNLMKEIGLYIHVPFCKSKCFYCDFNSKAGMDSFIPPYFEALMKELEHYSRKLDKIKLGTIFIGGGTPSYAGASHICAALDFCFRNFNTGSRVEVSMEANPGTLTLEKLMEYRTSGVNRLSMGLQAWQNRLLKSIGRIHTREDFLDSLRMVREAGFKNVNADLIFGLPGQTLADWEETLDNVAGFGLEHISCYSLKVEEGTLLGDLQDSGRLALPEDELDRSMYYLAKERLGKAGYVHYEISNFALPGFECRHNLVYWKAREYLGIGAGAHSYIAGARYNNCCSIEDYIGSVSSGVMPVENEQYIGSEEAMSEYMLLGMRLVGGVDAGEFRERFGLDMFDVYGARLQGLVKRGLVRVDGSRAKLTDTGLDLANQVFMEFV